MSKNAKASQLLKSNVELLMSDKRVALVNIKFGAKNTAKFVVARGKKGPKNMTLNLPQSNEALLAAIEAPTPAEARAARKAAAEKAKAEKARARAKAAKGKKTAKSAKKPSTRTVSLA